MQDPKILEVSSWLGKAQEDLHSAEWLLESPHELYNAVGFHCQQAAEKALKAHLSWVEQPFEKTHSLIALVGMCLPHEAAFEGLREAATNLTPYAVTTHYPGELPELSRSEVFEAIELARQVWNFVLIRLPAETHPR